ncbi:uncharacterized protein LOC111643554 [Copidosoma floridanum]|uniref:uncharacterized protein LOC111643554 n=1 Tax=Copidosoma floridanum TaxID=29053 RepID=UPI000C6FC5BE|nr:uncharacterized protein LOC111643554 [Copidosoma floridanum]
MQSRDGKGITYKNLMSYMLRVESEGLAEATGGRPTRAALTASWPQDRLRCFNCNDWDHMADKCPKAGTGLRKCYTCGTFVHDIPAHKRCSPRCGEQNKSDSWDFERQGRGSQGNRGGRGGGRGSGQGRSNSQNFRQKRDSSNEREETVSSEEAPAPPEVQRKRERPKRLIETMEVNLVQESRGKDVSFAGLALGEEVTKNLIFINGDTETSGDNTIYAEDLVYHSLLAEINKDPASYKEAMKTVDKEGWNQAIQEELDSMAKNQVWKLVNRPAGLVNGKVRISSILDGFLRKSTLDDEIYMELPESLVFSDLEKQSKVCKLQRALYGLKVSPKKWHERFSEVATKIGLRFYILEPCLFTWPEADKILMLVLYVDDMLIAINDTGKFNSVKERLQISDWQKRKKKDEATVLVND